MAFFNDLEMHGHLHHIVRTMQEAHAIIPADYKHVKSYVTSGHKDIELWALSSLGEMCFGA